MFCGLLYHDLLQTSPFVTHDLQPGMHIARVRDRLQNISFSVCAPPEPITTVRLSKSKTVSEKVVPYMLVRAVLSAVKIDHMSTVETNEVVNSYGASSGHVPGSGANSIQAR